MESKIYPRQRTYLSPPSLKKAEIEPYKTEQFEIPEGFTVDIVPENIVFQRNIATAATSYFGGSLGYLYLTEKHSNLMCAWRGHSPYFTLAWEPLTEVDVLEKEFPGETFKPHMDNLYYNLLLPEEKMKILKERNVGYYRKLEGPSIENMRRLIEQCNKRFIIFIVRLMNPYQKLGHANYLFLDIVRKTIERYAPRGSDEYVNERFANFDPVDLDNEVKIYFGKVIPGLTYYTPLGRCYSGVQTYQAKVSEATKAMDEYIKYDPAGYCSMWSIYYADLRLTYPDMTMDDLYKYMLKVFTSEAYSNELTKFIRRYTLYINTQTHKYIHELLYLLDYSDDPNDKELEGKVRNYLKLLNELDSATTEEEIKALLEKIEYVTRYIDVDVMDKYMDILQRS